MLRPDEETPLCQVKRSGLDSSCIEGSLRSVRCSPQVGRGSVAPRITLDQGFSNIFIEKVVPELGGGEATSILYIQD